MISGVMDEDEMESDDWNLISSRKGQEKRKSGRNERELSDLCSPCHVFPLLSCPYLVSSCSCPRLFSLVN